MQRKRRRGSKRQEGWGGGGGVHGESREKVDEKDENERKRE